MKLTDMHPKWIGAGGPGITRADGSPIPERHGVGIMFDCPCGGCGSDRRLFVPLANPLDGKGPIERGWERTRTGDTWDTWERTGDTFETLTLRPSILRLDGCKWHGYLTGGEFTPC